MLTLLERSLTGGAKGPCGSLPGLAARRLRRDALCPDPDGRGEGPGADPGRGRPVGVADPGGLRGGRAGVRRSRRQARPHAGAVAQHPDLFGLHVRLRACPERLAAGDVPVPAWPRHGRRVGERRGAGQRDLAREASRQGARHHAELLGHRLRRRRDRRRPRAAPLRLARGVLRRHPARALHAVDPPQRRRARDVADRSPTRGPSRHAVPSRPEHRPQSAIAVDAS